MVYEIDQLITLQENKRGVQTSATRSALGISDHMAKEYVLHFIGNRSKMTRRRGYFVIKSKKITKESEPNKLRYDYPQDKTLGTGR